MFAGLEALVLEELEKHLILNSKRMRTFEGARLDIVTYVEAKFGWRIRDSKPSDTGSRVDAVNFLSDSSWCDEAGFTMNGMMIGVRLDGVKVGIKSMTIPQAHFHVEVLILEP